MCNQEKKAGGIQQITSSSAAKPVTPSRGDFTPGPWYIQEGRIIDGSDGYTLMLHIWPPCADGVTPDCGDGVASIASLNSDPDDECPYPEGPMRANARLIASAPDLLAACRAAVKELDVLQPDIDVGETLAALRAAIALAEGK